MPWFKVDDDFYGHPKIKAIPRRHRNAAISLWVLAGSWCARYLTDGVIPDNQVQDLGYTQRDAANLVDARLWIPIPGGYQFHDWAAYQPTRIHVEGERERLRKRRAARRRADE
jgi:hypothetical protein